MRRNEQFILRTAADMNIILPVGAASTEFPGMISVNETGAFLWQQLETEQTPESLAAALTGEYEVELPQAKQDVLAFLEQLRGTGALVGEAWK